MERLIASGRFWQVMNIAIRTKKKIQNLGFLRFLAWSPANHDSKSWPVKQHNHTELSSFAMLWNMHWKEQAGGVMHLGLPRMLQKLSQ